MVKEINRSVLWKAPLPSVIRLANFLRMNEPERALHCDRCRLELIEAVARKERNVEVAKW